MHDAEFRLLVDCCRSAFTAAEVGGVPLPINWERFLSLACRHRVEAFAWRALREDPHVPGQIARTLAEQYALTAESNLRAASESRRLMQAFDQSSIPLIFVKGLTVAALSYADPLLKRSCDIDLLVPGQQVEDAAAVLRHLGYDRQIPKSGSLSAWHRHHKESVWKHEQTGQQIDLHCRLTDSPMLLPQVGIETEVQMVEIVPNVRIPTLARDELFAYLCVHGASSAWFRLKWVADFAGLLTSCSTDEIDDLYRKSGELGAGRAAGQALLLANRIFATRISGKLLRELRSSAATRLLAEVASQQLQVEREPTERFLGTAAIHWTQLLLQPGLKFAVLEGRRQVSALFR